MATIPDMDPYSILAEFGRDLCFDGTIAVQRLLPFGAEQEVRDEVRKQIQELWSRGAASSWARATASNRACRCGTSWGCMRS